jgi:cytochrome c oxidase cbb3-type subunit IV
MDLNDLRTVWTVLSFVAFLGIVFWAYSSKRKGGFDEAARLVLDDDAGDPTARPTQNDGHGNDRHGRGA